MTRILVVEDEEPLLLLLRYNLEAEGYAVDSALRGDEADLRLKENAPDLVLIDWMLPGLSGLELIRRLRARPETQALPIIMLTGRGEETERVRGLATGADDYVVKPFSVPELLARIKSLLRRANLARPSAGGIDIDGNNKHVTRDDASSRLKPVTGVPSAFGFGWTTAGKITIAASPANWPVFPLPTSEADHRNRLRACRTIAKDVISALKAQKYNARPEYVDALVNYHKRLPKGPSSGNILLADAEARRLRDLWASDLDSISEGLASRLKIFLEQHIGLRPYYPGIEKFYHDVQTGRIETPLPQDAVDGFVKGVRAHTPTVFDRSVTGAIDVSAQFAQPAPQIAPSSARDTHPADSGQPMPPADPLKEVSPRKARDYTIAGITNALWKTYLEGEKVPKAAKGWKKAGEAVQPYVGSILEWLRTFTGS
jgi:CheY-like chemotaxis protein